MSILDDDRGYLKIRPSRDGKMTQFQIGVRFGELGDSDVSFAISIPQFVVESWSKSKAREHVGRVCDGLEAGLVAAGYAVEDQI